MKVHQFLEVLQQNRDKELLFTYQKEKFVKPNYHVTEIKNVSFDTTDCGGKQNHWQETQLQLWESPREKNKQDYLTTSKVLQIFNRVNSINPLLLQTELKIEYGNEHFHTSVLKITNYIEKPNRIIFNLFEEKTQCKAVNDTIESCC